MAFIKCTRCGKQINNVTGGIIKCPYCQNMMKISEPKAEQQEDKKNDNETARRCPKCGGINLAYQREQIGGIGASTNKVVVQKPKKSKGCLYWLTIGFWLEPMYWIFIGWWWRLLFGGANRSGLNFNANKTMNQTIAICQNCGHTWKIS